jgi:hypothetical protein
MQLEIRTTIPEVRDMVNAVFAHMLVPKSTHSAGAIHATACETGFVVASFEQVKFKRDQLKLLVDMVRDEVHFQFMRARPELLWLHAAAVERNGAALLISGISGQGKSTLSTKLCERGWRILSDDISPTSMEHELVFPFPQMPRRRLFPGSIVDRNMLYTLEREDIVIEQHNLNLSPVPVAAIAYIEFLKSGTAEFERLSSGAAALELLRNTVNFADHKGAAVSRAAFLGTTVPAYRLCYNSVTTAVDHLESLL